MVRTKSGSRVPFSVKKTQKKGIQHTLFAPQHPTSTTGYQTFYFLSNYASNASYLAAWKSPWPTFHPFPTPSSVWGTLLIAATKQLGSGSLKVWEPEKLTQGALDDALQLLHEGSSRSEQKVADRKNILSKMTKKGHFGSKMTENFSLMVN